MTHKTFSLLLAGSLLVACTANQNTSNSSEPKDDSNAQRPIEVVVHRGANDLAPENTMPSADSALAHGATWIEVDVRTSKDGVMYNLHDETLDRTTDGSGNIGERTSDYIDRLDAGSWYDETRFKGLHVPTIEAMLEGLKGRANVFFDAPWSMRSSRDCTGLAAISWGADRMVVSKKRTMMRMVYFILFGVNIGGKDKYYL